MKNLTTVDEIILSIILLGSVSLLIHSLRPDLPKGQRRLMAFTGLFGLPYVAMDLCWHLYVGAIQSWPAAAFYFVMHSLGGASLAMILSIVVPKRAVLGISAIFIAFCLLAIVRYDPRHSYMAIRSCSFGVGLWIGSSISSFSPWFDKGKTESQTCDVGPQSPEHRTGGGE